MKSIERSIILKAELDLLRPLKKEDELRIMQKFRLDWNYHSNHLEGNSLTYGETKALILFGITAQGKPLKDHFEITGHDEAIKWVMDIVNEDRPLSENFIRELHKLVLKESYEVQALTPDGQPTKKKVNIGQYKTLANHVKTNTGEIFRFATPEETPVLMGELIAWYRLKRQEVDVNPILLAAEFHYRYIRIHPFDDGNGRTARIIMNFILMQFGYPPVVIKTEDKERYFAALRQADAGLLEPFINYIADNLNHSLELMIKGAKGESVEEAGDLVKEIALLEQKLKGVNQPITKVKSASAILDIHDQSIMRLADRFVSTGEVFEKLYLKNRFTLWVDNKGKNDEKNSKNSILRNARFQLKENTDSIELSYNYNALNQAGFQYFNFVSKIIVQFVFTGYIVKDIEEKVIYEKLYGEQLTEEEIDALVKTETRRHQSAIELAIAQRNENRES